MTFDLMWGQIKGDGQRSCTYHHSLKTLKHIPQTPHAKVGDGFSDLRSDGFFHLRSDGFSHLRSDAVVSAVSAVALLPYLEPQQSLSCPTWSLSSRSTWNLSSRSLALLGTSAVALLPHLEPQHPTWNLSSRSLALLGTSAVVQSTLKADIDANRFKPHSF